MLPSSLASRLRKRKMATSLQTARRAGRGLFSQEWRLEFAGEAAGSHVETGAAIADWCRITLAGCRRPWGINGFDLALAFSTRRGDRGRSVRFQRLDPHVLYVEDGLEEKLVHFLRRHCPLEDGVRIGAALFSWGEAAFAALPAA